MKTGHRSGFTLVELMIVAVVGAMVVGATYQILLSSQRALTVQTAQIQGQQTVRAGLDILFSELREISRSEGDILTMGSDRIEFRAQRAFGLVCGTSALGSPVRVQKIGRFFEDGDSVMVFADNDPDIASDDTILAGAVGGIDTTHSPFSFTLTAGTAWTRRGSPLASGVSPFMMFSGVSGIGLRSRVLPISSSYTPQPVRTPPCTLVENQTLSFELAVCDPDRLLLSSPRMMAHATRSW